MKATGVELFTVLTAIRLLILRMARGAKKASPIPLYVYSGTRPKREISFKDGVAGGLKGRR